MTIYIRHIIFTVMPIKITTIVLICFFLFSPIAYCTDMRLGTWISIFSKENVLQSTDNIDHLLDVAQSSGIDDIYIQIYRADKAYYNSSITDASPYENLLSQAGTDTFEYLIKESKGRGISVHAWINLLSIAQNKDANIIKTLGKSALTLDQHGRTSLKDKNDPLDKYYLRETQFFLEAGNPGVRKYLSEIAGEIVKKYPDLTGIHLDYIRYPFIVPFIPGSRFTSHGISYGYGKENLDAFKRSSGIDIASDKYSRRNFLLWDNWRRDNVTSLVRDISEKVRDLNPDLKISCTISSSIERTYFVTLQDWTLWIDKDYIDYVVAMDYTDDIRLLRFNANSIISQTDPGRTQIGMAAYLLEDQPEILYEELNSLLKLPSAGVVIFSYDDIAKNEKLQKFLAERFN